MIKIPVLKKKDMEVFKDKRVLFYGTRPVSIEFFRIFQLLNIEVVGYSSEIRPNYTKVIKDKVRGFKYFDSNKIEKLTGKYENIIWQSVDFLPEKITYLNSMATSKGFEVSRLSSGQIFNSFQFITVLKRYENKLRCGYMSLIKKKNGLKEKKDKEWEEFKEQNINESPIIICTPQKTADYTLNHTFDKKNREGEENQIAYFNLEHRPKCVNRKECEKKFLKLKILIGVREPISQNLSALYQGFSNEYYERWISNALEHKSFKERCDIKEKYKELYTNHADDVQALWDVYCNFYVSHNQQKMRRDNNRLIQLFIPLFKKNILDITEYSFDKNNGYTVIKEGNTEVFVYQLEKLNDIVPQLSEWVGIPFDKLEQANVGTDKWVGESYQQALQEIEITQEYFDCCFNEPYVQHCYSQEDIEKFKARWRPHIKTEKKKITF